LSQREDYPNQDTPEELLSRFQRGEQCIFGEIVRAFQRELYSYLVRYTGDSQLAEDIFQNTFLQVYLKISQYEIGRPARPWIYRIATNQAIDYLRSVNRHQAISLEQTLAPGDDSPVSLLEILPEDNAGPAESITREEDRLRIRKAIVGLPAMLRGVVILAYFQDLKYHEIAEILEIPVGTVKSRLHNALNKIQLLYKEQSPQEFPVEEADEETKSPTANEKAKTKTPGNATKRLSH
jgi:RNA polymerase sigma-70 factor, ECF subfamily